MQRFEWPPATLAGRVFSLTRTKASTLSIRADNVFYGDLTREMLREILVRLPMTAPDVSPEISSEVQGDARWALIERIAASQHLKPSARLCDFLFYVSDCAIREAPEEATEQQIGIRIFHRHPGYNSSEDSIVRTHARLLRQKIAAYFAEEGIGEEFVVDIPKGHYLPVFHPRAEQVQAASAEIKPVPTPILTTPDSKTRSIPWKWIAPFLLLPISVACALFLWHPWSRALAPQSALDKFWSPFFTDDPPLVIYSNAVFVGDSTNGLRYAHVQEQGTLETDKYVETYTGIGELASVYALTTLFDAHQAHFILKRSLLMTWDEAKLRNLIFIGARVENPSLRVLPPATDFTMEAAPGTSWVVNHHPKAGEPAIYSRPEHPFTTDYATLALLPGIQPGTRVLVFSGLTTFGTQAAVEYLCRPESVAELLKLITGPKGEIRPFEAVLETTIGGGVPLQTRLVTIRVH